MWTILSQIFVSDKIDGLYIFDMEMQKSRLQNRRLYRIIYSEVIGIDFPIALSKVILLKK